MQGYAWLSVIVLLAVAGAVHAAGISLSHRPAAAAVAALPWALFLLGFGAVAVHAAAPAHRPCREARRSGHCAVVALDCGP